MTFVCRLKLAARWKCRATLARYGVFILLRTSDPFCNFAIFGKSQTLTAESFCRDPSVKVAELERTCMFGTPVDGSPKTGACIAIFVVTPDFKHIPTSVNLKSFQKPGK